MSKSFTKMHGLGNDFIVVEPHFFGFNDYRTKEDTFSEEEKTIITKTIRELCRPKFGIGADGFIIISAVGGGGQFKMTYYNQDSSFDEMCGNGLRCVAAYVYDRKGVGADFILNTDCGRKPVRVDRKGQGLFWVKSNLGAPSTPTEYDASKVTESSQFKQYLPEAKIYNVNIGIEHMVVLLPGSAFELIAKRNAFVEIAEVLIQGKHVNVNFCTITGPTAFKIVTYEHGIGLTLACGTGSGSSAFTAFKIGALPAEVTVETQGGLLTSRILTNAEGKGEVELQGPAQEVFTGNVYLP